jgi:hypothetical protein
MATSSLKGLLEATLGRVSGLVGVYVSDKDGVVLEGAGAGVGCVPAHLFATAAENGAKMGLGRTRAIVATYPGLTHTVVAHVNACPLVVTFLLDAATAAATANVGMVLALAPELVKALEPLSATVDSVAQ